MPLPPDKYRDYVPHPRYGRGPQVTGLNPSPLDTDVNLHWNATSAEEIAERIRRLTGRRIQWTPYLARWRSVRIPNTAVVADLSRQSRAMVQVTHYFDIDRVCKDCDRPFIFFAAEQKHWYEELGFGLESDCVRCVPCRKLEQGLARLRERYQELFHAPERSDAQNIEMAECCLTLTEAGVFGGRQAERVRFLLNRVDKTSAVAQSRVAELLSELLVLKAASHSSCECRHALQRVTETVTRPKLADISPSM